MQSQSHNCQLTHGRWSPTRAGVFFISKSDGCIDVWDLLDRTSDPVLTQSVSPHAITKLNPIKISSEENFLTPTPIHSHNASDFDPQMSTHSFNGYIGHPCCFFLLRPVPYRAGGCQNFPRCPSDFGTILRCRPFKKNSTEFPNFF